MDADTAAAMVDAATSDALAQPDWGLIMELTDACAANADR